MLCKFLLIVLDYFRRYGKLQKLKKNFFKYLTLKPLSETRWEGRLESIKAMKNATKINKLLIEVSQSTKIPEIKSEAISLVGHEMSFEFNAKFSYMVYFIK